MTSKNASSELNINKARDAAIDFVLKKYDFTKGFIGLGSGSTMLRLIDRLGKLVQEGAVIKGVSTSYSTSKAAKASGIELVSFNDASKLHFVIDGADQVDPKGVLIKGGGGCLVSEKIVGFSASKRIIIVDELKIVDYLGGFALPIEVIKFGHMQTLQLIIQKMIKYGCKVEKANIRQHNGQNFLTEHGNYIIDVLCPQYKHPSTLFSFLSCLPAVVEVGIFDDFTSDLVVGRRSGFVDYKTFEVNISC